MKILVNFLMVALGVLFLTGCGGGGGNGGKADFFPYVENSNLFKSFTVNANKKDKMLLYYPVPEDISNTFVLDMLGRGFEQDEYGDTCWYLDSSRDVGACTDTAGFVMIWSNVTNDFADEYVEGLFPYVDAPLSARVLTLNFDNDQSSALLDYYNTLKSQDFKSYDDGGGRETDCLRQDNDWIVYSFCHWDDGYRAEFAIYRKTLFDIAF